MQETAGATTFEGFVVIWIVGTVVVTVECIGMTFAVDGIGVVVTGDEVDCEELHPAMMIIAMHNKKREMPIIFRICC